MQKIRHVEKPWGFEIWWAHTDAYAGKLIQVERGRRLSLQYHQRKDESCYLLTGRIRLVKGPSVEELESTELLPGATWRNQPGEIHTVEALERAVFVEASTPELEDVVRLVDDYDRVEMQGPDVVAHGGPTTNGPARLLDREQLAAKLKTKRSDLDSYVGDPSFPEPVGYFRGRVLWEEAAVDVWLHRPSGLQVVADSSSA